MNWKENKDYKDSDIENINNNLSVNEIDINVDKRSSKAALNDLLLNLSIDETNTTPQLQTVTLNSDIPNDLFESRAPELDLFGEPNVSTITGNNSLYNGDVSSNVNLLNDLDLFASNTVPPIPTLEPKSNIMRDNLSFISSTTTVPTLKSPTTGSLHRNTSTPNLAKLDPLAELGSFLTSTSTTTKPNSPTIPRVSSFTTFQTANGSKPDYNRNHFVETPNINNNNNNTNNARVVGNEFEDLLGFEGFKRTQNDLGNKSIAQLRKDEMV